MAKFGEILRQGKEQREAEGRLRRERSVEREQKTEREPPTPQKPGRKPGSGKRSQPGYTSSLFLLTEKASLNLDEFVLAYNREAILNGNPKLDRSDVVELLIAALLRSQQEQGSAIAALAKRL